MIQSFSEWQNTPDTPEDVPEISTTLKKPVKKIQSFSDWSGQAKPEKTFEPSVLRTIGHIAKGVATLPYQLIKPIFKPSEETKALEKDILPTPKNTYEKIAFALPNTLYKIPFRFFAPAFKNYADILSQNIVASKEFDKVGKGGSLTPEQIKELFPMTGATNLQAIGSAAEAGLAVYAPEFFAKGAMSHLDQPVKTALMQGFKRSLPAGLAFGTAQALSSGSKDPHEIAEIVAVNTLGAGLLGMAISGTIPISKEVRESLTKKIKDDYNLPDDAEVKIEQIYNESKDQGASEQQKIEKIAEEVRTTTPVSQEETKVLPSEGESVTELSKKSVNSLENETTGTKEKSLEYFREHPEEINKEPIRVRKVGEETHIEDGRHRLQVAKEMGVENLPVEDVTKNYPPETPESAKAKGDKLSRVYERVKTEHPELDETVKYESIRLKEEAEKATKLIEENPEEAFQKAMGFEESKDVTSTSINIALTEKALEKGEYKLASQLVKNRSLAQTRRGQEIVSEKASVTDNSAQKYMKELIAARLQKIGKKYLSKFTDRLTKQTPVERAMKVVSEEVKKARKVIKSRSMDIAEAQKLIDSLAC